MKYIAIPETIYPLGHMFLFREYVHFLTENHAAFDASAAAIRAAGRIQAASTRRASDDKAHPGHAFIELRPEDYELLAQANAAPSGGYPILRGLDEHGQPIAKPIAKLLLPYIEAIEQAQDALPEVAPPAEETEEAAE